MPDASHPEVRAFVADKHIESIDDAHIAALLADRDAIAAESADDRRAMVEASQDAEVWRRQMHQAEAERDDFRGLIRDALAQRDAAEAKLAQIAELHREKPEDLVQAIASYCVECGNDWPCDTVYILTKGTSA